MTVMKMKARDTPTPTTMGMSCFSSIGSHDGDCCVTLEHTNKQK